MSGMTPELTKKLARIEAACRKVLELDAKATKDWSIDPDIQRRDWEPRRPSGSVSVGRDIWFGMSCDDAAFIAFARSITPDMARALLAAIRRWQDLDDRLPLPPTGAWDAQCPYCGLTVESGPLKHRTGCIVFAAPDALQSIADSFQETSLP